ncbi:MULTISPECIES: DUF2851 family protein [Bizionia]|uniref:DUF2851 family protein n=1 Tax=Bizionia algoritergicola TaxID=291187 RepID=A0A5D0QVC6_9FLAO|nr:MULTISPECIES: DUF2851 family protein [Bizionia]OBX22943.1 hypothetical protein BAA08_06610 [Bizionia sp. APA-3]TYB72746.1 DUF2851 family protein [Bizionia algoritergicola]
MQEAFLHYLWQFKKFQLLNLKTTQGQHITVVNSGQHNQLSGPDFFAAQLKIDDQLWAGNVEIHIKSSDWYVHHHEKDPAYQNVILHVVWEHDTDVFRKDNTAIPALELKNHIDKKLLDNYYQLFSKKQTWINCESEFSDTPDFVLQNWLERLYIERLEQKSVAITSLLVKSKNNWEAVLFAMLAKNFGLNINGDAFLSMAQSLDFAIIRKLQNKPEELEALFLGQAGLLSTESNEPYELQLNTHYLYLKNKFQLDNSHVTQPQFFKLRPPNFPTIRLSQLAILYTKNDALFSKIMGCKTLEQIHKLFQVGCSEFWRTHFTFQTTSKPSKKILTKNFINLVIINTVVPLKFAYNKKQGTDVISELLELMAKIPSENNTIVNKFNKLKAMPNYASVSQALLQLKTQYCKPNKCLQCAIGNRLISK